jgi:hypothetical protein
MRSRPLLLASCLLLSAPALADEFTDHAERVTALMAEDRYEAALAELEAAYSLRQSPRLLYDMARAQQRLGRAQEALALYRRFLATQAEPALRGDAEAQVRALQALTAPVPPTAPAAPGQAAPPPPARPMVVKTRARPDSRLIVPGAVILGLGYVGSLLTGSLLMAYADQTGATDRSQALAAGSMLLIPVAGPFISGALNRQASWIIPMILLDGVGQAAGLGMILAGARHKRQVPVPVQALRLLPYADAQGGGLTAAGSF